MKITTARFYGNGERKSYPEKLKPENGGDKKTAILLVSVGKPNFEKDQFKAILGLINAECDHCIICVSDTLQRFNIEVEEGLTPDIAYETSLERGISWRKMCDELIQKLDFRTKEISKNNPGNLPLNNCEFEFKTWDELKARPDFNERSNKIEELSDTNETFKSALLDSREEYCTRRQQELGDDRFKPIEEKYRENCLAYLKEECAAMSYWEHPILYPGKCTSVLEQTLELTRSEFFTGDGEVQCNLKWIQIRYKDIEIDEYDCILKNSKQAKSSFLDTSLLIVPEKYFENQGAKPYYEMQNGFSFWKPVNKNNNANNPEEFKLEMILKQQIKATINFSFLFSDPFHAFEILNEEIEFAKAQLGNNDKKNTVEIMSLI